MKQFLLALLIAAALAVPIYAQDDETGSLPGLTLVNVQTLDDLLGASPRYAALSPDGNLLVYESRDGGRGLCVYRFDDENTTCTPYETASTDENPVGLGSPTELNWSPDSRFVALTENFLLNLRESDIWVYDVENGAYINQTEDNFTGNPLTNREDSEATPIDISPIWSPEGSLYFSRYVANNNLHTTELHTIPSVSSTPASADDSQPVADFSPNVPMPFVIYNLTWTSLGGGAEVSPDGTRLALLMRPTDLRNNQLWIVDLADGSITQRLTTEAVMMDELPEWIDDSGFIPEGLTWVNDSALVLSFINRIDTTLPWLAYHIDLETDGVTPVFDFADIPSLEEYHSSDANHPMPRFATVTPDGEYLLYVNMTNSESGTALEAVPVQGGERLILYRFGEDFEGVITTFNSIGADGTTMRALMGGYVFSFEAAE